MTWRAGGQVRGAGGLQVLVLSIQESERVARQLKGRAGRQGDPGETRTLVSLDDPIIESAGLGKGLEAVMPLLESARPLLRLTPVLQQSCLPWSLWLHRPTLLCWLLWSPLLRAAALRASCCSGLNVCVLTPLGWFGVDIFKATFRTSQSFPGLQHLKGRGAADNACTPKVGSTPVQRGCSVAGIGDLLPDAYTVPTLLHSLHHQSAIPTS